MIDNNLFIIDKTEFNKISVASRSDGIMMVEIKADQEVDVVLVKRIVNSIEKIGAGKRFPLLIVLGENTLPNAEARSYVATTESDPYAIAEAYVINSFTQKLVSNIYTNLNKPARPTKFFNSQEKAVEWLKSYL
jgi:hypothetical protein